MQRPHGSTYRLERRVADHIATHDVLRDGESVLLLLSGGADSMALLHLLEVLDVRAGLHLGLAALHVDYGMRGADSDRDREIVERACARLEVPLHVVRLSRRLEGGGFQEQARKLRHERARELSRAHGHDAVVTAHNADDQAETILYRLTKYASPRGLVGMRPRERQLARPLLCLRAGEIREYCHARGIDYGVDVTNLEPYYARNLLRLEVLPTLCRINPRVVETLSAAGELAAAEADVLAAAASAALARVSVPPGMDEEAALDIAALQSEPAALQALLLHEWVRHVMGEDMLVERSAVTALLGLVRRRDDAGRISLGGGLEAARSGGRLRLRRSRPPHTCPPVTVGGADISAAGPAGVSVRHCGRPLRVRLLPGPVLDAGKSQAHIGLHAVPQRVTLRHPARGERFAPLGLGSETTVARYLSAARASSGSRPHALVLDVDGQVAWVGIAEHGADLRGRVACDFPVNESSRWTLHVYEEHT